MEIYVAGSNVCVLINYVEYVGTTMIYKVENERWKATELKLHECYCKLWNW